MCTNTHWVEPTEIGIHFFQICLNSLESSDEVMHLCPNICDSIMSNKIILFTLSQKNKNKNEK